MSNKELKHVTFLSHGRKAEVSCLRQQFPNVRQQFPNVISECNREGLNPFKRRRMCVQVVFFFSSRFSLV